MLILVARPALAISLIRDAEIEHTLRTFGEPIFEAAGLQPEAVHLFIIGDPEVNAYVAGGQNMFIQTGLILDTDTPDMLIGVMAHETGHMAGGHVAQGTEKMKNAQLGALLSAVLGLAAAASGAHQAGGAIIAGGQQYAMRNFLSYSRSNENAADQAGLSYLDALNYPDDGMLQMFNKLWRNEQRRYGTPDAYVLTHPLTIDRISHIRDHHMDTPQSGRSLPADYTRLYDRMIAKLRGFTQDPELTLRQYPLRDTSEPALYARAVAYYKIPDLPKALSELGKLLALHPKDPFFHELRGQILFENGKVKESLTSYRQASALLPSSPLIMTDLAKVELAQNPPLLSDSIAHLERSTALDSTIPETWEMMAIAYGKNNNLAKSYLARAELAALDDNQHEIAANAKKALALLPKDSPSRLRAEDLKNLAEHMKQDQKEDKN